MVDINLKLSFLSRRTEGMVFKDAATKEKQSERKIQNSAEP